MTEPQSIFDRTDRRSPEYRLGIAQMMQWKEQCRCKRLGIPFRPLKLRANHGPARIYKKEE